MYNGYIALQELQAVAMLLYKLVSHLSGKVVHLDNSIVKAYLCIEERVQYLFLSRIGCHTLNLAAECGMTHCILHTNTSQYVR